MDENKYRTRSPEEWRKHDEEMWKEYERLKGYRKRSIRLTIFNLVVAVMIVVGFLMVRNKPVESGVYRFVEGFSVSLLGKDVFEYPDPIDFTVKIVNTRNKQAGISIDGFSARVYDESGNVVYTFDYPSNVSKDLPAYGSVVVFKLSHEVDLSTLSSGDYEIRVDFRLNGKPVTLSKKVEYKYVTEVIPAFQYPFYLVGEPVVVNLLLRNRSPKTFDASGGLVTVDVMNEKGDLVRSLRFQLGDAKALPTTEELYETGKSVVFDKTGIYTFRLRVQGEDFFVERSRNIFVVKEPESNFSGLSIFTDVPRVAAIGDSVPMKFYMVNEKNRKRFLECKGYHFAVKQNNVPVFEYKRSTFRLVLLEYEKRVIFDSEKWKELKFFQPGRYSVEFSVDLPNGEKISKAVPLEIR